MNVIKMYNFKLLHMTLQSKTAYDPTSIYFNISCNF